jgi:peptidoglycan hydrolase-like protein with peptidoglycan-binding domain
MLRRVLTVTALMLLFPLVMAGPALADIAVDGVFGPQTRAATLDFQRDAGISVDGVVGPQTRRAMGVSDAGRHLRLTRPMQRGDDVRAWQRALNRAGASARGARASRASRSGSRSHGLTGIARRVARCESGLDPNAQNPRSSASGLFQFIDSTWRSVTGLAPPASAYSVGTQVDAFYDLWDGGSGAGHWAPSRHCWS